MKRKTFPQISEPKQTKEDLRKKVDRLGLIAQVGQKTTAILELDELLHQAVNLISETFDYYNVIILLVDGNWLVLKATTLASIRHLEGKLRLRIGVQGITGRVAENGQPMLVPDVRLDSRYYFVPEEKDTKSEIAVPIKLKGKVIGVLDAQSRGLDAFSQADLFTLQTLADQLAIAIENARLYEQASQEIAERKKAEEALRASEKQYRTLVEHLPLGVYRTTPDGKFLEANQTLVDLLGCKSFADLSNYRVDDFYARKRTRTDLLKRIEASVTYFTEFELRRKDSKKIWVRDYSRAISGKDGKVTHYDGILADITAQKIAEKNLNQALVELERSNAELQQFAYVASHDLQEPLRMVASFVKLLEERYKGKLEKDADEFIAFAVEGATRMQKLIIDLLTYSRLGIQEKSYEPADCGTIIDQALSNLKVSIEESKATVTYDRLPTVMGDSSQLTQLFQNLIGNAIKFHSDKPPEIQIRAIRKKDEWIFSVEDNGIGIEPAYAERIFKIFQRLHSRTEYPGTGIGLAICKKIVERHGGRIWIDSIPRKGSVFHFTLPVYNLEPED